MGIAPYKTFTFDGVSSDTYGVYITGEGVFNAPERDVDMLEIPGRNGAYVQDKGRFKNIKVTYKAGMFDVTESNFADKIANLRNWLGSKKGYVRLSDEYNPNEYRMAVFYSGIEVDHDYLIAGEFEITFECKPQRFLTSGETASAVANNGTLSNPTLFDSSPLLAVKGYGNISFNGFSLDIQNDVVGDVVLHEPYTKNVGLWTYTNYVSISDTYDSLNNGDTITIPSRSVWYEISRGNISGNVTSITINSTTNCTAECKVVSDAKATLTMNAPSCSFAKGTSSSATASSVTFSVVIGGTTYTRTFTLDTSYNDTDKEFMFDYYPNNGITGAGKRSELNVSEITGYSTISTLGNPSYIDCDIGECYMYKGGYLVTLNNLVAFGSDLPVLASGTNTFTYDNTITELKVTPRWWKI